jgi:hypothetical protein
MEAMLVHCLSVVSIHYIWRRYARWQTARRQRIGSRVAYMLWVAAQNRHGREHSLAS